MPIGKSIISGTNGEHVIKTRICKDFNCLVDVKDIYCKTNIIHMDFKMEYCDDTRNENIFFDIFVSIILIMLICLIILNKYVHFCNKYLLIFYMPLLTILFSMIIVNIINIYDENIYNAYLKHLIDKLIIILITFIITVITSIKKMFKHENVDDNFIFLSI
jgi:hypothetical protein